MSIKDYPTEQLLAEIAARVRTDSPLYDPQELRDMLIKSESECSELRAQVGRVSAERDALSEKFTGGHIAGLEDSLASHRYAVERLTSDRDALQARIDAGVRVWGAYHFDGLCFAGEAARDETDTHTALLIDPQPIADHVPDAGKMVDDDRKWGADRRKEIYGTRWGNGTRKLDEYGPKTLAYARSNCRRRTPGTKADRKPSWTRADGSVTPERQGERRKGQDRHTIGLSGERLYYTGGGNFRAASRNLHGANDRRKGKA